MEWENLSTERRREIGNLIMAHNSKKEYERGLLDYMGALMEAEAEIKRLEENLILLGIEYSEHQISKGDFIELRNKEDIEKFIKSLPDKVDSTKEEPDKITKTVENILSQLDPMDAQFLRNCLNTKPDPTKDNDDPKEPVEGEKVCYDCGHADRGYDTGDFNGIYCCHPKTRAKVRYNQEKTCKRFKPRPPAPADKGEEPKEEGDG